jgi:hypothetical protein
MILVAIGVVLAIVAIVAVVAALGVFVGLSVVILPLAVVLFAIWGFKAIVNIVL